MELTFPQSFPILHGDTLSIDTCPPRLLGAITSIGASFSTDATAQEYSVTTIGTLCTLLSRVSPDHSSENEEGAPLALPC